MSDLEAVGYRFDALLDELVATGWPGEFDARERYRLEQLGYFRLTREQAEFAQAWERVLAALPEGVEFFLAMDVLETLDKRWSVEASARTLSEGPTGADWTFSADFPAVWLPAATPTAALVALLAKLEERK